MYGRMGSKQYKNCTIEDYEGIGLSELKWTGERFLPEVEGNVKIEHMHRYQIALNFAQGKKVLDIACGEGYGSNLLAKVASSVIGVDVAYEAILHAKKKYSCNNNIRFIQGDCAAIPISDNYIDLVVSFETIEHHARHKEFILEIKRVLKEDGLFIISSPDKKEYSDFIGYINEYHVKELYYSEFEQLIKENFKHFSILGQRIKFGSYITPLKKEDNVNPIYYKNNSNGLIEEKNSIFDPLYFIALASDEKITQNFSSLYEYPIEKSELVTTLSNSLKLKINECNKVTDERDTAITECNQLTAELMATLNSSSWYITKPLRCLKRKFIVLSDFNVMNSMKNFKRTKGCFVFKSIINFKNAIQSSGGVKSVLINKIRFLRNGSFNDKKNLVKHFFSMFKKSKSVINSNIPATPIDNTSLFEHSFCLNYDKSNFVDYNTCRKIDTDIRLIAFFLPQFYPIKENDEVWGKGFTEWTNVTKALPQFSGHYQPKLPGELGFYDLRLDEIKKKQIEVAKNYGIQGFCYHYYWFGGGEVLKKPLEQMLAHPDMDFPFCINWANENWTKRWDGLEDDIILKQKHSPEDDMAFIQGIEPILKDKRYIKVNGKPLLMIYRPALFPEIKKTVKRWREYCKKCGMGDIYLVLSHAHEHLDPRTIGFDAATEFAPNTFKVSDISNKLNFYNNNYHGHVFDYNSAIQYSINKKESDYKKFRSICPGWDNEARRPGKGISFHNASPENYSKWLEYLMYNTLKYKKGDERIIFLNAWNEWAEGAYLEPDSRYGYAYLAKTYDTLKKFNKTKISLLESTQNILKTSDIALIVHLYYIEQWDEIKKVLKSFKDKKFNLYLTINNNCTVDDINNILEFDSDARIFAFENRGRDILPFLKVFNMIYPLNYKYICKIHSKKSLHRQDGNRWRQYLIKGLLGSLKILHTNLSLLENDSRIGIIVAKGNILKYNYWIGSNNEMVVDFANKNKIDIPKDFTFPSGSMFWFKPDALKQFYKNIDFTLFVIENGQFDGTMAHSVERLFGLLCHTNGYELVEI